MTTQHISHSPASVHSDAALALATAHHAVLPNADYTSPLRRAAWLIVGGLGGFLLWAGLAPMDEGVPTAAQVSVETKRKRVEHLTGGLVQKILVKDGQHVEAGQELVLLNELQGKAALESVKSQWVLAAATVARLEVEREGLSKVRFPTELETDLSPAVRSVLKGQRDLLMSKRRSLEGELRIVRESVKGLRAQLTSLAELRSGREKQVSLFNQQLGKFQGLQAQGFVSQNQLLDIERQLSEVQSKQAEDLANIAATNARLAEFELREQQIVNEYRKTVETELSEAQRDLAVQAERMKGLSDSYDRLVIRAPVAGTVVDVAVNTVGGVVKPGDRVLDIVPAGEELVVEARLPPQFIDRVRPELLADVHFDAYVSMARRPILTGVVQTVSADVMTDPRTGVPYYSVRVRLNPDDLTRLKDVKLFPGMQCSVTIKTGERTLLAYLMRPLLRRTDGALLEH